MNLKQKRAFEQKDLMGEEWYNENLQEYEKLRASLKVFQNRKLDDFDQASLYLVKEAIALCKIFV